MMKVDSKIYSQQVGVSSRVILYAVLSMLLVFLQSSCSIQRVQTVNGLIKPSQVGVALTHEHIMSTFGDSIREKPAYETTKLLRQVIPHLTYVKSLGVRSIFDCTAAYFGRDVLLLKRIADSVKLNIITNTGIYGAANDRYVPAFALQLTASELAKRWVSEFQHGIDGTDIKPGFIKLAFDTGTPSPLDKKLFEAGVLTHLQTGLTLAVHTGNNAEAVEAQLKILDSLHVSAEAWIWVHANQHDDINYLVSVARRGAWISLDGASNLATSKSMQGKYREVLLRFKSENLLDHVLLSHDGNSYNGDRPLRSYHAILTTLVPLLEDSEFTQRDIDQLLQKNPTNAFSISVKKK